MISWGLYSVTLFWETTMFEEYRILPRPQAGSTRSVEGDRGSQLMPTKVTPRTRFRVYSLGFRV